MVHLPLQNQIKQLKPHKNLLQKSKIGLEKEGLRVAPKGGIAHTPHPSAFGSALTQPYITTDFSESLLELITPPCYPDVVLKHLADTQHFVYKHLENEELFWAASMPCVIRGETSIPLAQYGPSNIGTLKTVYRRGLGCRYGTTMQVIAGIHFNYSYSQQFWQVYQKLHHNTEPLQHFINHHYMALVRNLLRFNWLIIYLFGASPAICRSFLNNQQQHSLIAFTKGSLYEPFATSLRTGDIGYQNLQEDKIGVKANYNSLSHYTNSLKLAMQTPSEKYQAFSGKKNGQYQQINANLLQIENEYYASVRPKPKTSSTKKPAQALNQDGIDYVELRSLDINPLTPLGIDKQQQQFLEVFFLFCLLSPSPAIASYEQVEIDNNTSLIAHGGTNPNLRLKRQGKEISVLDWGMVLLDDLVQCVDLFGKDYRLALQNISTRLQNSQRTPSQTILNKMRTENTSFFSTIKTLSMQYKTQYQDQAINQVHFEELTELATKSAQEQQKIEQKDTLSFDDYLKLFNEDKLT